MATEKTRAPSFARSAARGRPTTSDLLFLRRVFLVDIGREGWASRLPVDDGYGAAVGAVAVGQQRVVDTDALERFYDA